MISVRKLPAGTSLSQPFTLLATWFGSGLLKPASGTWGSLASLPFVLFIFMMPIHLISYTLIAFIVLTFMLGLWAAHKYMQIAKKHDASEIVIDETCGLAVSFLPLLYYTPQSITELYVASCVLFLLFRIFDAGKPFPISYLDKNINGTMGVMVDDIAAGLAAALTFILGRIIWAHLV
jgi:phosphatidylglycerophosphatase A